MKKLLAGIMILFAALGVFSADVYGYVVAEEELYKSQRVNFINYTGVSGKGNPVEKIKGIGYELSDCVMTKYPGELCRYESTKYLMVRVKSDEDLYSADIFFIGKNARVDHIKNIRRILSAYIEKTYGYTTNKADEIAVQVTNYNAMQRQKIDYFKSNYSTEVMLHLTEENVGIAILYSDWPGNTEIVIPTTKYGKIAEDELKPVKAQQNIEEKKEPIQTGCCLFSFPGYNAKAIGVTIGAIGWYAWGKQKSSGAEPDAAMESDPAFLYGPIVSVKLDENLSLRFVYLYGKFDYKDKNYIYPDFKSKHNDVDLALNYRLNDYLKIFASIKYLSFDMAQVEYTYGGAGDISANDGKHTVYGGGLGLTATLPLAKDLFILATMYGFTGWGSEKIDVTGLNQFRSDVSTNDYGFNSNISIAYYIDWASTTISLGGRYQYLMAKYKNDSFFPVDIKYTIYGITLSAEYSF